MSALLCLAQEAPRTYGTTLDYVVIVSYMIGILLFGSFFGRFAKSTSDFFFSGGKFAWWLIGMSIVATGVGSHSFMKYSQTGYEFGLSSGMAYMNDWFFIPFFMFGWLPIIYYSRVRSIPEYFQRRFNTTSRLVAVVILLMYMIGYIGYNLFTLGVAAKQILGVDVNAAIIVIAVVSGIYITAGGQTAVIFTDLIQGFMLLAAGLVLFVIGLSALGLDGGIVAGLQTLWANLSLTERLPLADYNQPPDFNFVNVFWQDGVAGSVMFLFISQGLIMRFLAARSVNEGRKCILFNTVFVLPIAMIVVSNAGWLAKALERTGLMPAPPESAEAFVTVAEFLCKPGVFGFVLAALSAALMSTMDTLTNASAALFVYDIYQPYLARNQSDRHHMVVARIASAVCAAVAMGIGLFFVGFGTQMYKVHGAFQAFVTPPIVAAVFMGAFWKRFTPAGAIAAMVGGTLSIWCATKYPVLVAPFATWIHGVQPDANGQYSFMTALFGLVNSALIGVVVSLFTRPKPEAEIAGLWIGSVNLARAFFKGGQPNDEPGRPAHSRIELSDDGTSGPRDQLVRLPDAPASQPAAAYATVRVGRGDLKTLRARPGDLVYVADDRWWLGGLRSLNCRLGEAHDRDGVLLISPTAVTAGSFLPNRGVKIEKVF